MKVYKVSSKDGRAYGAKRKGFEVKILVHLDTYRGLSLVDMENIGALEYFGENDTVCLVEWGEGLEDYLKKKEIKYRKVLIRNIDQNIREFNL